MMRITVCGTAQDVGSILSRIADENKGKTVYDFLKERGEEEIKITAW